MTKFNHEDCHLCLKYPKLNKKIKTLYGLRMHLFRVHKVGKKV